MDQSWGRWPPLGAELCSVGSFSCPPLRCIPWGVQEGVSPREALHARLGLHGMLESGLGVAWDEGVDPGWKHKWHLAGQSVVGRF